MSEPFNDLKQVELSVEAAKDMIGAATMSMDTDQLKQATEALNVAKSQLQHAKSNATGVDGDFLNSQENMMATIEEQLEEAKR